MTTSDCRYGFRIVGGCYEGRRLVDAAAALSAHAAVDPRCEPDKEAYLSAFYFDETFRRYLQDNQGSTAGYSGPCWSPWLWLDIDREDLQAALRDACRLAGYLDMTYKPGDDDLLCFFSGSKGFHVGLPTALWSPTPSLDFHKVCRRFAENVATLAAVTIDTGVYDRVRAFRAPNSRHPKTGLHKRRLSHDELTGLPLDGIVELSRGPAAFALPTPTRYSDQAAADWQTAIDQVGRESEAKAQRRANGNDTPTLNRATIDFIREGAGKGDRHRLLFSAAANLAEFGCTSALAVALLTESALDSGLPPKEVRRQIECGHNAVVSGQWPVVSEANTPPSSSNPQSLIPNPLPPLPSPLAPLPPGAVGLGTLEKPCKCGSREFVDVAIGEGRSRRDCRKCGRFLGWGQWYEKGGAA